MIVAEYTKEQLLAVADAWRRHQGSQKAARAEMGIGKERFSRMVRAACNAGLVPDEAAIRAQARTRPHARTLRTGKPGAGAQSGPRGSEKSGSAHQELQQDYGDAKGQLASLSSRIRTLEQLLRAAKVDQDVWSVDRYVVNKWEVGAKHPKTGAILVEPLFQVKAWLRRRPAQDLGILVRDLVAELRDQAPVYEFPDLPSIHGQRLCYVVSPVDIHLAKLAWCKETGEDYDTQIAERLYRKAVSELMGLVSGLVLEQIVLVVGQDWFHVDNQYGKTARGTDQDIDSRWQRAFLRSRVLLVETIEMLARVAPVLVLVVPGNHDYERVFYLGEVLDARFTHTDRIQINNSPRLRKYHRFGVNLVGFTHGSDEKQGDLPLIMAREEPQHWAESRHREWLTGHLHKMKETKYTAGDSWNGVRVRVLPSLCGTDAWHYRMGYVKGIRAAEAYLYSHNAGYVGHFSSPVLDEEFVG